MDPLTISEILQRLGWINGILLVLASLVIGLVSFYLGKKIESIVNIKNKKEEEIREIKRKRYEEFIEVIESILSRNMYIKTEELLKDLNKVYSKMYISVPKEVVRAIKKNIKDKFDANSRKEIYLEIRKDLLGVSDLELDDLCYFEKKSNEED